MTLRVLDLGHRCVTTCLSASRVASFLMALFQMLQFLSGEGLSEEKRRKRKDLWKSEEKEERTKKKEKRTKNNKIRKYFAFAFGTFLHLNCKKTGAVLK